MKAPNTTPQIPSRDDHGTTTCPVCRRVFTPTGRQAYCSTACRKTAFRRRHQQPGSAVTIPGRPAPPGIHRLRMGPGCGERQLGEQRCETCRTFTRRIGVGGPCPHCLLTELPDVS